MRRALLIAVLAVALVPSAAEAQTIVSIGVGPGQGRLIASTTVPVRLTGYLTVRFSGARGTGCAVHGLCGYSGSIYWRPAGTGTLFIDESRSHRRNSFSAFLFLPSVNDYEPFGAVTTARVQLSLPGGRPGPRCNDAQAAGGPAVSISHAEVKFSLGGGLPSLLTTRCAGPLNGANPFPLPSATMSLRRALRGMASLSLVGRAERVVDGVAITSTSTLTLSFGRSSRQRISTGGGPTTGRFRQVEIDYRLVLSGGDVIDVHGDADPRLCNPLGSCGLSGTLALQTGVRRTTATVFAIAPRNRPWRDLLHALGLSRQGSSRGVQVLGGGSSWNGGGEVHANLRQLSEHCSDAASLFGGSVELNYTGRRMVAGYSPNSVRTPCPGPFASSAPVATVGIPLGRLRARLVRLRLDSGTSWQDDGYTARTVPHLLLTLTRERVHEDLVPGP